MSLPPILYGSFFALLVIQVATAIGETVILSLSSRGTITITEPRRKLERYIHARVLLGFAELGALIACTFAVSSPSVTDDLDCSNGSGYSVALRLAQAAVIFQWIIIVSLFIKWMYYVDPLGCCTPGLIQYLTFLDASDDHGSVPSPPTSPTDQVISPLRLSTAHLDATNPTTPTTKSSRTPAGGYFKAARRIASRIDISTAQVGQLQRLSSGVHNSNVNRGNVLRRLRALCCCLGVGGHRSRGTALEDVARALYTLFHGTNVVLSDIISGLVLLHKGQERKMSAGGRNALIEKFREVGPTLTVWGETYTSYA